MIFMNLLFDKLFINRGFIFFQYCSTRATHERDEEVEIHPRRGNEPPSRQPKSKNSKVNFAEANTWPSLVEQSFQNLSSWLKLKLKYGFKIAEPNGRERSRQKWNSACAHPGTCTVLIIREFITATNTVTLEMACRITVVNQVYHLYFVNLNCLTRQRTEIIQAFWPVHTASKLAADRRFTRRNITSYQWCFSRLQDSQNIVRGLDNYLTCLK